MAFKRSAVRSRLSPPKTPTFTKKVGVFLTFRGFLKFWVNKKVNRRGHFRPLSRRKDGQDGLHSGKGKRKEDTLQSWTPPVPTSLQIRLLKKFSTPILMIFQNRRRLHFQSNGRCVASAGRGLDIPLTPPVMLLRSKNF